MTLHIRAAQADDEDALWEILEPVLRAGETYALPRDWTRDEALAFWLGGDHGVYVAEDGGRVIGTYYLHPNQRGGGSHVANCGYVTRAGETGRGVARAMAFHSLDLARKQGFRAMQFNFVVSTNERAVALWASMGFEVVGRLPEAFRHPKLGLVDALVMLRRL
ncbi:MAG: GNAT family N-acetyltransferase [Alsobacter sp.]